jgi:3-phosphoshikimate 1-carboxyvinyltransferase
MSITPLPDPYPVQPLRGPLDATIRLPGSKSLTNRALVLAALAQGDTCLEGVLFSRDTEIMLAALQALGFSIGIEREQCRLRIHGEGGCIPNAQATIEVGNAGTAARFLTAMLCLHPGGTYQLDGDPPMRGRPMRGLTDALESLGVAEFTFHGEPGHFPFTLRSRGWSGGHCVVDAAASSQILSALLLTAPCGSGPTHLICDGVRPSYVTITRAMCNHFGASIDSADNDNKYTILPDGYRAPDNGQYAIEPDLSAASYWLALTLIHGGSTTLPLLGQDTLQGDVRFAELLSLHGLQVEREEQQWRVSSPGLAGLKPVDFNSVDFEHFSDTFLTYAAILPLLGLPMQIEGITHTRRQETDRIAGMAHELARLGQQVHETEGSLTLQPNNEALRSFALEARTHGRLLEVETYEDHRFAMSFGVLASYDLIGDGEPWLAIRNPSCCSKTYPDFFQILAGVGS